ncbi:hypothetical protein [Chryseolinea sp. H1M3-3]|uniref:hypothetical protein n=1 Tax=Chryseolinea sp. H1M3-3 TaxID=3034144 RepID=UPI0023EAA4D8|nr:hypothetical protein [Chryseolinea sp. H1M3-3]
MELFKPILFVIINITWTIAQGQQIPDRSFSYENKRPAYMKSGGPVVTLDESHFNFHTLDGRYSSFGKLLANDGYVLKPGKEKFTLTFLRGTKILVIANALGDTGEWKLPTRPAFTNEEVIAVEQWVKDGGCLFIIADHMPCAGAAANLAEAFGFNFINGFAFRRSDGPEMFTRTLKNLSDNVITKGRDITERIDSIQMFTGSAFLPPPEAVVISSLDERYVIELSSVAWEFNDKNPKLSGRHFANGAMLQYGKGRVVIFGEAAMFTAQLQGPHKIPMGMNQPTARQNAQLLLNIIHWLDGKL